MEAVICPHCKGRTEVLETIQRDNPVTRRRRRCTACTRRFSTVEIMVNARAALAPDLEAAVKQLARGRKVDVEAVAAAIRVDRRKIQIAREQRERDRYDDEHAAPSRLGRHNMRREMKGY